MTSTSQAATLPPAVQFFYDHGATSYDPATETPEQGKLRGARDYAAIERGARVRGWYVDWRDDGDGDHSYLDQDEFDGYEVTTCEMATLYDRDGDHLAAMGCIDDADDAYRRVIEAQLVEEALYDLTSQAQARDNAPTTGERRTARNTVRTIQDNDRAIAWAAGR